MEKRRELDVEWMMLIMEAKAMGLSIADIQDFLKLGQQFNLQNATKDFQITVD